MSAHEPKELQRLFLLGFRDARSTQPAGSHKDTLEPAYKVGVECGKYTAPRMSMTEETALEAFQRLMAARIEISSEVTSEGRTKTEPLFSGRDVGATPGGGDQA